MNAAPDFNRLARLYRWMEFFSFGPWLAMTRRTFIGELGTCRRALVLGDGDGRFTARLLRENPHIRVDAVDASQAMLAALLRRGEPNAARITSHLADARLWQPVTSKETYDLVATHFFLDCFTQNELEELAKNIRKISSSDSRWVVSEFAVPQGWFGTFVARPLVAGLYLAFGRLTGLRIRSLPNHAQALRSAGFFLSEQRLRLNGLLIAEMWSNRPAWRSDCAGRPSNEAD